MEDKIIVGLMGDVMLGRQVAETLAHVPDYYIWGDIRGILKKSDLNIINLECVLTTSSQTTAKANHYKTDPHKVSVLKEGNIHVVNLANNHILDFGPEGLNETLITLDQASIDHVGAGKNLAEAKHPVIFEKNGIRIGILGCTDNEPDWAANESAPGTFYVPVTSSLEKEIKQLKEQVDVVILTMHWGPNMREKPAADFIDFAHKAVDWGVDLFHGHSAHVFQGVEVYRNSYIFYDTGDFINDYSVDPALRNDQSLLFLLEVTRNGPEALILVPVVISNCQVNQAGKKEFPAIIKKVKKLSKQLGTILA